MPTPVITAMHPYTSCLRGGNAGSGTNASAVLGASLGTCGSAHTQYVVINEVTTAAMAFALGQFFTKTLGGAASTDLIGGPAAGAGTYNVGLVAATANTVPLLANNATGSANPSTAAVTLEAAKLYSIANTLAACVNSGGNTGSTSNCGVLFADTTPPGSGTAPSDTLQAAVQMSLYPYQNVTALYQLGTATAAFVGLPSAPNDWTLAAAYSSSTLGLNISGNSAIHGSANLDIDAAGRVWFPSNSSSHGVAYFDPASTTFNGPYSTGHSAPQYVAIDHSGNVWATDTGSAAVASNSVTTPTTAGTVYTTPNSISGTPIVIDTDNTPLFIYSTATGEYVGAVSGGAASAVVSGVQDTPTDLLVVTQYTTAHGRLVYGVSGAVGNGCGYQSLPQSTANYGTPGYVYNGTGSCSAGGGVITDRYADDYLMSASSRNQMISADARAFFTPPVPVNQREGIAVDGAGRLWIANAGNASVSTLAYKNNAGTTADYIQVSPVAYLHGSAYGNTMTTPYGLAIDRSGNVWVANASCVATTTACAANGFVLSEMIGTAAPTITPLSVQLVFNTGMKPTN